MTRFHVVIKGYVETDEMSEKELQRDIEIKSQNLKLDKKTVMVYSLPIVIVEDETSPSEKSVVTEQNLIERSMETGIEKSTIAKPNHNSKLGEVKR